ncbi:ankyrin repeat domain-containing protein [Halarcobacter sp.]|uniref:ankyrin repeat domain-containing protein n=1 Tax=Halarcobacter sp. TaxID=2321133 RepID=UPI0029F5B40D|nr:ankyrin repeat domain-containing protein [Halarcobacter sp.]
MNSLEQAIKTSNVELVKTLLEDGANPDGSSENPYLKLAILNKSTIEVLYLLLTYGASPKFGFIEEVNDDILSIAICSSYDIKGIKLLLEYGANLNFKDTNARYPIQNAILMNRVDILELLLEYGEYNTLSEYHSFTLFSILDEAVIYGSLEMIEVLFNNGIDNVTQSDMEQILEEMEDFEEYIDQSKKQNHTKEEYDIIEQMILQEHSPYLKLSNNEKYIIYDNDDDLEIHTFVDRNSNKKYLYADNKIDAFIYWCYTHNLLYENFMSVVETYLKGQIEFNYKHLENLLNDTLGKSALTTDYFSEQGKQFAIHYLTVTHWWYNYHTDFNKLYQEENIKLPRKIKEENEFKTVLKLLDKRYEQYLSKKNFNANQNKEELKALLEEQEIRPRYIQLRITPTQ